MPLLSVKNLQVKLGSTIVLSDVSFDLEAGRVLYVIGPNGAGKTTLVKAILGLIDYHGQILIDGKPVKKNLNAIGYVPQSFDFDRSFPLTVEEFLLLAKKPLENPLYRHISEEIQVTKLLGKKLGSLSGGQLQRVLIAQAFIKKPKLIILDEPTAGVDMEGVKSFYDIIGHLKTEHGLSIILISHEISMVYKMADDVLCLNKKPLCFDRPGAVTRGVLEKLYGGDFTPHIHYHNHE